MSGIAPPPPLVPADADLRGYNFMPFYGDWLRASDFNATCTDAEYRAAVNLWWSSWHQLPPASLPDNDVALCRAADLGRDMKAWLKVKKVAMSGFTLCADGRWYHEFLSIEARMQWDQRLIAVQRGKASGLARRLKAAQRPPEKGDGVETLSKAVRNGVDLDANKGRTGKLSSPPPPRPFRLQTTTPSPRATDVGTVAGKAGGSMTPMRRCPSWANSASQPGATASRTPNASSGSSRSSSSGSVASHEPTNRMEARQRAGQPTPARIRRRVGAHTPAHHAARLRAMPGASAPG
jgi:hypothetical protein